MFGKTNTPVSKYSTSTQGINAGQTVYLEGCDSLQSSTVISVSSTSLTVVSSIDEMITLELNAKGIFSQVNTSSLFPLRLVK